MDQKMKNIAREQGAAMRVARQKLGLSQRQLANQVGTSAGYLSFIETGNNFPSHELAMRLNQNLGTNLQGMNIAKGRHIGAAGHANGDPGQHPGGSNLHLLSLIPLVQYAQEHGAEKARAAMEAAIKLADIESQLAGNRTKKEDNQ